MSQVNTGGRCIMPSKELLAGLAEGVRVQRDYSICSLIVDNAHAFPLCEFNEIILFAG
ncbi:MAG: hypothetical protein AB7S54_02925 [Bacteroidales bacterium]